MEDIEEIRQKLYLEIEKTGLCSIETQELSKKINEMINLYYLNNEK